MADVKMLTAIHSLRGMVLLFPAVKRSWGKMRQTIQLSFETTWDNWLIRKKTMNPRDWATLAELNGEDKNREKEILERVNER